ncbi:helix-turn-helix transcriptional regulator [Larkinella rosea]|uniref:YafY family transcriptional regulator n=1 Tax=Larkinella rosea TaxID=2025312 RepID=A0A3P1BVG3_9BACT|nr:YafY family protein [Larkinella rosea]RRB04889.1 YafY family transcriptional regulator [Larkinella rosea]
MNRIDRLTAILIHLQTKRVVKAQELAKRFQTSLRTIYRDIRSLEEAGVPIGAEAGIGYFLEDYHLPPVMLTREEASALLFGAKVIEKFSDASIRTEFESALYKIKSVLKRKDQEHLEDLEPRVHVEKRPTTPPFSDMLLSEIQRAIGQRQVILLDYRSAYNDENTRREVEPVGLYHYGAGWHLIAFCRLRQDYRDFRVDRIRKLDHTGHTYSSQNLLTLPAYLDQIQQTQNLTEVIVRFDKKVARHVQESKYQYGYVSEERQEEYVRMKFMTQYAPGLGRWLLMFGKWVQIETPDSLRETMRELVAELQEYYLELGLHG